MRFVTTQFKRMLQGLFNRLYRFNIGTRTAMSFMAVVLASLVFSVAALVLLEYSKKIDTKISDKYRPVISALKDYQTQIETTILLTSDISSQYNEKKRRTLKKQLDRTYNEKKLTVIGMSQETSLEDIRKNVVEIDKEFQKIAALQRQILNLMQVSADYSDQQKLQQAREINENIEEKFNHLSARLEETSMEAIYVFRQLETQKYASYRTLSYLLVIMIVLIIAVSIFSIYVTNVTVIRPIKEMSAILDELSEGKIITFRSEIKRNDEVGTMIASAKKVVDGFKAKSEVANAIGKGNYNISVPLLSRHDKLGKALQEMKTNLNTAKENEEKSRKNLEAYTINLEKKNRELDQFAYIASHDLKSPLRGINNLTEWIKEELGDQLSGDSLKYFHLLRGRVHRMEALINSLSKYARAGRSQLDQERIQSKDIVLTVLRKLNPGPQVAVYFDETLPEIDGNRKDLEEVFLTFVSNAIHHNTSKEKLVNITYHTHPKEFEFCIADNGPGIAAEFHDRIFTIFQTLDRRDEVENVGAGLAIVKKIVEEYGGRIWLESEPGKGSKFYFSWPRYQLLDLD
ncbi:MAG: hypothetical protein LCH37_00190 [Bacteroidetes bacterium]|nr:hypothetical protein [Bacteroidota bacterium]